MVQSDALVRFVANHVDSAAYSCIGNYASGFVLSRNLVSFQIPIFLISDNYTIEILYAITVNVSETYASFYSFFVDQVRSVNMQDLNQCVSVSIYDQYKKQNIYSYYIFIYCVILQSDYFNSHNQLTSSVIVCIADIYTMSLKHSHVFYLNVYEQCQKIFFSFFQHTKEASFREEEFRVGIEDTAAEDVCTHFYLYLYL